MTRRGRLTVDFATRPSSTQDSRRHDECTIPIEWDRCVVGCVCRETIDCDELDREHYSCSCERIPELMNNRVSSGNNEDRSNVYVHDSSIYSEGQ